MPVYRRDNFTATNIKLQIPMYTILILTFLSKTIFTIAQNNSTMFNSKSPKWRTPFSC